MSNATNGLLDGQQEIIGTRQPARNRYGQNGYQGPSSEQISKGTHVEGFQKQTVLPAAEGGWQTRAVEGKSLAPSYGMTNQAAKLPVTAAFKLDRTRNKAKA